MGNWVTLFNWHSSLPQSVIIFMLRLACLQIMFAHNNSNDNMT